jgi:uncharacterized protein YecE (DUF72 family)
MILIGTSGYSFLDWVGPFYPPGTEKSRMLDFYARHFPAVEVNATYYRIPPPSTLHAMERKTPEGFQFVVKAHHDMTHDQSLDSEIYRVFARAVEPLRMAGKLSGFLAQFPYGFRRTARNEEFLVEMKLRLPEAPLWVEFRHASWIRDDVFAWMDEQGIGYVSVDEPDLPGLVPPVARATGPGPYVRFHGRNKENWWRNPERGRPDRGGEMRSRPLEPAAEAYAPGGTDPGTRARARAKVQARAQADFGPLFARESPAGGEGGGAGGPSGGAGGEGAEAPAPGPSGTSSDRYDYLYSEAELQEWVQKIRELAAKSKKTFVFFNNCHVGQAATGAKLMRRLLEGEGLL